MSRDEKRLVEEAHARVCTATASLAHGGQADEVLVAALELLHRASVEALALARGVTPADVLREAVPAAEERDWPERVEHVASIGAWLASSSRGR